MTFRKLLTIFALACMAPHAWCQLVLSSHDIELQKADAYHEAMPAPEAKSRGLVVFAADKNTITALRYTQALYYADSLAAHRPATKDDRFLAGYSYDDKLQPSAYWANSEYDKIIEQRFDFESGEVTEYTFEKPYKDEILLLAYSANNSFNLLTRPEKQGAMIYYYTFNKGQFIRHALDFSGFKFKNPDNDHTVLYNMLDEYGISKMEIPSFNPLPAAAAKIKLYVTPESMVFTFDQNPVCTQLFTVDTNTYNITEKTVNQLTPEKGKANSFWHRGKLYQITIDKQQVSLTATDLTSGEVLQTHMASAEDNISFKNSELLEQTGYKRPNIFKNTKKFLRKAAWGLPGISVYQTPDDIFLVAGSIRDAMPAGQVIAGSLLTGAMAATGTYGDAFRLFPEHTQSIYFESLFSDTFTHKDLLQQRLATDYVGQYFMEHQKDVKLQSVFPYDYYYVAGYYNSRAHKYILVRFEDDTIRP